jgi:SPP1 family predicted phage head-tail adaptor
MADLLVQNIDLAYTRLESKQAMPDKVHVQRRTLEADKQGGYTESWSIAYDNVPARLSFNSGAESFAAGREDTNVQFMLTVPYDQSVEQSDRILFGEDTFEVVSVSGSRSWDTVKRCQVRKV